MEDDGVSAISTESESSSLRGKDKGHLDCSENRRSWNRKISAQIGSV